jgi:hypothetical protein
MRGRAILVLLGLTAFGAYSVGRQSAPASNVPVPAITSPSALAKPVAFSAVAQPSNPAPAPPSPSGGPTPSPKARLANRPAGPDNTKRNIEAGLTAAAIAAIIVQASRDQYHAGGRPCACPDDTMRNGRACGGRSAYSRPGGASPLCYSKRLGNMTLLDPAINVDIGNKAFDEKLLIYRASPLLITQEIAKNAHWGPDEIDARQAVMAATALDIWKL